MTRYAIDFGIVLRQVRHFRGLSQKEMAEALGVNLSRYLYFELGKILPDTPTLKTLAKILDVPIDVFQHPEKYEGKYVFIDTDAT